MSWSIIILAAGKGTRLQSSIPKPLVPINGIPLIQPILDLSLTLDFQERIVVISEFTQGITHQFSSNQLTYIHSIPKGTAHAVLEALPQITTEHVVIAQADDSFLYTEETLSRIQSVHISKTADFTVGLAEIEESITYRAGIWDEETHELKGIKEEKISHPGDRVVCGLYAGRTEWLQKNFPNIPKTPSSGEFGIPTGFLQGIEHGDHILGCPLTSQEWMGVNTPEELEQATRKVDVSRKKR